MDETLSIAMGVKELRFWVSQLIEDRVEKEQRRASEELKSQIEWLHSLVQKSLQQTLEGIETALSGEHEQRRKDVEEIREKLQAAAAERRAEAAALEDRVEGEHQQRRAELRAAEERAAEDSRRLRSELASAEERLQAATKTLAEDLRGLVAQQQQQLEGSLKGAKKDARDRLQEAEARQDVKLANLKEELEHKVSLAESRAEDQSKELVRALKQANEDRKEDRHALEHRVADEKREREAALAKEASARKGELSALQDKLAEELRQQAAEGGEGLEQHWLQITQLDERLAKEARDRSSEAVQLRSALDDEVAARKQLSEASDRTERQLQKHMDEAAAHRAAMSTELAGKSSARETTALAQALESRAREAKESVAKCQEKLLAAIHSERQARRDAISQVRYDLNSEVAQLGDVVGRDVGKLNEAIERLSESERSAREALSKKVKAEQDSSGARTATEISQLSANLNELRGHLDACREELSQHHRSTVAALNDKGSDKDVKWILEKLEQIAKEEEAEHQTIRLEFNERCSKIANALRESCNALHAQHEEHAAKVEECLSGKGDSTELLRVQEALDSKADKRTTEEGLESLQSRLDELENDLEEEKHANTAALESKASASAMERLGREVALKAPLRQLDEVQDELESSIQAIARGLERANENVSALKEAAEAQTDAMEAFSTDLANTVSKKINTLQKSLDSKADLSAAAACVHVSQYLKDRGVKTVNSKKMAITDTCKLSIDDINDLAITQAARRSPSRTNARRGASSKYDTGRMSPGRRSSKNLFSS
uniref:Uncharacterized protein n=1 Tax=Tetraselmis sp. GSL018 TaxID=582737 RepID=A0A061QNZ3_9CHLO